MSKIKSKKYSKNNLKIFKLTVLTGTILGLIVFIASGVAKAAPPDITIRQGAVAASAAATYQPSTPAPVTFNSSGACPRWSGTINDAALGSNSISSNITASKLEAGTTVTFAITLQNTSTTDAAYDILLNHDIPAGFELPGAGAQGANVCVHNGAGTAIPFTANGTGFFGSTDSDNIELTDGGGGALTSVNASGSNIAVITFDLRVSANYTPGSTKNTTAELLGYSDTDNGTPLAGGSASTSVKTRPFEHEKTLLSTNQTATSGNFAVIGEQLTYELTVTIPEGVSNATRVVDEMADGLALVSCDSITNDDPGDVTTNLGGGLGSACNDPTNPAVTNNGKNVEFTLGDLTNNNRSQASDETITIVYTAVVNNVAAAANNASLNNAARIYWTGDNTASASAPVIVHEPLLATTTAITPSSDLKAGSKVTVIHTIKHTLASTQNAPNVTFTSAIPAGLEVIPGTLNCSGSPTACAITSNQLSTSFSLVAVSDTITISYEAIIANNLAGQSVNVSGVAGWTSMVTPVSSPQSPYSATTLARTANTSDPGGAANTYLASSNASLAIAAAGSSQNSGSNNGSLASTGVNWWAITFAAGGVLLLAFAAYRWVKRT